MARETQIDDVELEEELGDDDELGSFGTSSGSTSTFDTDSLTEMGPGSTRKKRQAKKATEESINSTRLGLAILGGLVAVPVVTGILPLPFMNLVAILGVTGVLGFSGGSYLEGGITGGLVMTLFALFSSLSLSLLAGFGIPMIIISGIIGVILGGIGVYAGRDARKGFDQA